MLKDLENRPHRIQKFWFDDAYFAKLKEQIAEDNAREAAKRAERKAARQAEAQS